MKTNIWVATLLAILFSCKSKERELLQTKVDSLTFQLIVYKEAEDNLNEVGILIDSIDIARKSLQLKMTEGTTYSDYVQRLKNINAYVHQTEAKLVALEKSSNRSLKLSQSTIGRLKADLAKRSNEVVELQMKLAKEHEQAISMWVKLATKDSLLSIKDEVIQLNQQDITYLEKLFNSTQDENRVLVSNLYFAQAQAMETAANRTHFAPRKRKETRREALELYKLAVSLGNTEAEKKIDDLEKKIN